MTQSQVAVDADIYPATSVVQDSSTAQRNDGIWHMSKRDIDTGAIYKLVKSDERPHHAQKLASLQRRSSGKLKPPPLCATDGCAFPAMGGVKRESVGFRYPTSRDRVPDYRVQEHELRLSVEVVKDLLAEVTPRWAVHESGIIIKWVPITSRRTARGCRKSCHTHNHLQTVLVQGNLELGVPTQRLWDDSNNYCELWASTLLPSDSQVPGIRLLDLAMRLEFNRLTGSDERNRRLLLKTRRKGLVVITNLFGLSSKLEALLDGLQIAALRALESPEGFVTTFSTVTEHAHTIDQTQYKCYHRNPESDNPGRSLDARSSLSPLRVVKFDGTELPRGDYDEYAAISYVWTETNPTRIIQLLEDQKLGSAVNGIWIDQKCIRQDDNEEKSKELPNMRDYYENARDVYVILPNLVLPGFMKEPIAWQIVNLGHYDKEMEDLSKQWDKQIWRTRVWTYQEGTANIHTTAVCKNGHVKLSTLEAMIYAWRGKIRYYARGMWEPATLKFLGNEAALLLAKEHERTCTPHEIKISNGGLAGKPLRDIIPVLASRNCSKPLDRVYGVLSLCSDKDKVKVDYEQTEGELLMKLASSGMLSMDTLLTSSPSDLDGLSWMPKTLKDLPIGGRSGTSRATLSVSGDGLCAVWGFVAIKASENNGMQCQAGCLFQDILGRCADGSCNFGMTLICAENLDNKDADCYALHGAPIGQGLWYKFRTPATWLHSSYMTDNIDNCTQWVIGWKEDFHPELVQPWMSEGPLEKVFGSWEPTNVFPARKALY